MKVATKQKKREAYLTIPEREQTEPMAKVSREIVKLVNFITATRIKDPAEFTLPKYIKIETDRNSK